MNTMRHLTPLAAVAVAAALGVAEPGDVSWRLIRPTNTVVPGDYCQTIFIDANDTPWIGGYTPF